MKNIALLVAVVFAVIAVQAAKNEVRGQWKLRYDLGRAPGETVLPISIALRQKNLDVLKAKFERITDPNNAEYAQWMTVEEISNLIAPNHHEINEVLQYVKNAARNPVQFYVMPSRDFVKAMMSVSDLEEIFKVKMYLWEHAKNGQQLIRSASEYSIPSEIAHLIDVISMVSDFPASHLSVRSDNSRRPNEAASNAPVFGYPQASDSTLYAQVSPVCQNGQSTKNPQTPCSDQGNAITNFVTEVRMNSTGLRVGGYNWTVSSLPSGTCGGGGASDVTCNIIFNPNFSIVSYQLYSISIYQIYADGTQSTGATFSTALVATAFMTPQMLWKFYDVPIGTVVNQSKNTQSVAEFSGQYYTPSDLSSYLDNMSLPPAATSVVGPNNPNIPGDEATLDIEWIMGSAPGAPTVFWSVGKGAYLLEWANEVINTPNPPLVHSISYAGNEAESPAVWQDRVNVELMKMGSLGLSVVVASGDAGASDVGHGSDACLPLQPQFPSSSPYVTTVSATFFTSKSEPICYNSFFGESLHCGGQNLGEVAVAANNGMDWTTGGGFSNRTIRPSWQDAAVSSYLKNYPNLLPPANLFNSSGRGYPDVSAVGHNLMIIIRGGVDIADGTSASTPIFAGVLTLINDYLLANKKPSVGFVNPLLYQLAAEYPETFYDVTYGDNKCGDVLHPPYIDCCADGYKTSLGWDPVTGLGTPRFAQIRKALSKKFNIPM